MARLGAACLAVSVCGARAWWDNGHMLTAEVARQVLGEADAQRFDALLGTWEADFPNASDLVTSAVWPDMIKCTKVSDNCRKEPVDAMQEFSNWHFTDIPYNPDRLKLENVPAPDSEPSVTWALAQAMETFQASKSPFAFNLMLRFTTHFVGDLHQPLHAVTGYFSNDKRYGNHPQGDRGGNDFHIKSTPGVGVTNLHMLWDAAGGLYMQNWPYNADQKAELARNATEIMKAFPPSSMPQYKAQDVQNAWSNKDWRSLFVQWANETYAVAVSDAYGHGITEGEAPSDEYIRNAQHVSQHQIALGGYRLAEILKIALPNLPSPQRDDDDNRKHSDSNTPSNGKVLLVASIGLLAITAVLLATGCFALGRQRARLRSMQQRLIESEAACSPAAEAA